MRINSKTEWQVVASRVIDAAVFALALAGWVWLGYVFSMCHGGVSC